MCVLHRLTDDARRPPCRDNERFGDAAGVSEVRRPPLRRRTTGVVTTVVDGHGRNDDGEGDLLLVVPGLIPHVLRQHGRPLAHLGVHIRQQDGQPEGYRTPARAAVVVEAVAQLVAGVLLGLPEGRDVEPQAAVVVPFQDSVSSGLADRRVLVVEKEVQQPTVGVSGPGLSPESAGPRRSLLPCGHGSEANAGTSGVGNTMSVVQAGTTTTETGTYPRRSLRSGNGQRGVIPG